MPEKPGFFDTAKRFFREITKETVFIYDPAFTTDTQINQDGLTATTHWKRNADGSIVIGKDQIEFAIKSAKAFEKTLGKKASGRNRNRYRPFRCLHQRTLSSSAQRRRIRRVNTSRRIFLFVLAYAQYAHRTLFRSPRMDRSSCKSIFHSRRATPQTNRTSPAYESRRPAHAPPQQRNRS